MNRLLLLLFFTLTALAACQLRSAPATGPVKAIEQWSGQRGGPVAGATRVLRSEEEWSEFWNDVGRDPPRPLNTPREMAVAVFLGERRTGGYSVNIVEGRAEGNTLVVTYREKTPGPGMSVSQALTSPWAIAIMPRSDLSVVTRKLDPQPPTAK